MCSSSWKADFPRRLCGPHVSIVAQRDVGRSTRRRSTPEIGRGREVGKRAVRADATHVVVASVRPREPDFSIRPGRYATHVRLTAEQRDGTGCGYPPDLAALGHQEPEIAVRADGDGCGGDR